MKIRRSDDVQRFPQWVNPKRDTLNGASGAVGRMYDSLVEAGWRDAQRHRNCNR